MTFPRVGSNRVLKLVFQLNILFRQMVGNGKQHAGTHELQNFWQSWI